MQERWPLQQLGRTCTKVRDQIQGMVGMMMEIAVHGSCAEPCLLTHLSCLPALSGHALLLASSSVRS